MLGGVAGPTAVARLCSAASRWEEEVEAEAMARCKGVGLSYDESE